MTGRDPLLDCLFVRLNPYCSFRWPCDGVSLGPRVLSTTHSSGCGLTRWWTEAAPPDAQHLHPSLQIPGPPRSWLELAPGMPWGEGGRAPWAVGGGIPSCFLQTETSVSQLQINWDWGSVISPMRIAFSRWLCWSFVLFSLISNRGQKTEGAFSPQ